MRSILVKIIFLFFLNLTFLSYNSYSQLPPGVCDECNGVPPATFCSCVLANGCGDFEIEDEDGNIIGQPCIPVNTNSWVLIFLGVSLVVVSYIIHKKAKN
jgi:hypothetical protein